VQKEENGDINLSSDLRVGAKEPQALAEASSQLGRSRQQLKAQLESLLLAWCHTAASQLKKIWRLLVNRRVRANQQAVQAYKVRNTPIIEQGCDPTVLGAEVSVPESLETL